MVREDTQRIALLTVRDLCADADADVGQVESLSKCYCTSNLRADSFAVHSSPM